MLLNSTDLLRLSQGHLNLLAFCPRKFQHTYLEQLTTPTNPEQEKYQTMGKRFHLLMQQQEMGLPIHSFLQADTQIQSWMTAFTKFAPEILTLTTNQQQFRASEYYRTLKFADYLLTVIYDLLIAEQEKAQIIDWKTYPKPPTKNRLIKHWQTRLYLYILVETSDYLPENISMNYWFFEDKDKPKNIQIEYDDKKHQQTEKQLKELLNQFTNWLENYQKGEPFPQVEESKQRCQKCEFVQRCDRLQQLPFSDGDDEDKYSSTNPTDLINYIPNLDIITEVSL